MKARDLNASFLSALGDNVLAFSEVDRKPLELDLRSPLPSKVRVYLYTLTDPPGGRSVGEHKIQIIVPGQRKGAAGYFDYSNGRLPLLAGYHQATSVFVLWDATLHEDFSFSRNVQVCGDTVFGALAGHIVRQIRQIRSGEETVLAALGFNLAPMIAERFALTITRVLSTT